MNPQIKQKLEELTDLISKSKIEGIQNNVGTTIKGMQNNEGATIKGWQNNQGATIEGKMIFDSKTNFKKGIWKVEKTGLVEYELTPKK